MNRPIRLWRPCRTLTSDDACTTIYKYVLPAADGVAPYKSVAEHSTRLTHIPSLAYFCIQQLLQYPDQVHSLGTARLIYRPPETPEAYDLLRELIPQYRPGQILDLTEIDPRLWALIVQLYTAIPAQFRAYTLPLSDEHLPLLQNIPPTPGFALLTTLELSGCAELTDDSIIELKALHSLCAFDASGTSLSAWGIRILSKTLTFSSEEVTTSAATCRQGPWGLRIFHLRDCINITNKVFESLCGFPLLSVVDLRGTRCTTGCCSPFQSCDQAQAALFDRPTLPGALSELRKLALGSGIPLFSHQSPFILRIIGLCHPKNNPAPPRAADTYTFDRTGHMSQQREVFLPNRAPRTLSPYHFEPNAWPEVGPNLHTDEQSDSMSDDDQSDLSDSGMGDGEDDDNWEDVDDYTWDDGEYQQILRRQRELQDRQRWAAEAEALLHAHQQAAQQFYARPLSRGPSHPAQHRRLAVMTPRAPPLPEVHPLMFFRDFPPWSSLPASADAFHSQPPSQGRRKRTRLASSLADNEVLSADQICVSEAAKGAVAALHIMVESRRAAAPTAPLVEETIQDEERRAASANPFARSAKPSKPVSTSCGKPPSRPAADREPSGTDARLGPPHRARASKNIRSQTSGASTGTSDVQDAPRRFKPISQLPVPVLPTAAKSSSTSATKSKSKSEKPPSHSKQTTISTSLLAMGRRSDPSPLIHVAASASKSKPRSSNAQKPNSKLASGKTIGRASFNWTSWSTSKQ